MQSQGRTVFKEDEQQADSRSAARVRIIRKDQITIYSQKNEDQKRAYR